MNKYNILIFSCGFAIGVILVYAINNKKEIKELEVVPEKPLIDPEVLKKFVDESVDGFFKQAEFKEVKYGVVSVNDQTFVEADVDDKPDEKDLEKTYEDVGIKKVREESEELQRKYEEKASRSTKSYNDVKYEDLKIRYAKGALNNQPVIHPDPYIINEEDYFEDAEFERYDKLTLTYYEPSGNFIEDGSDKVVDNIGVIIGEKGTEAVLNQVLNSDSYVPVYIRNEKLKIDYEITIVGSSYQG